MTGELVPDLRRVRADPRHDALVHSLGVMLLAWTLLALGALLVPWLGRASALFVSFASAAGLMLAVRPARGERAARPRVVVSAFLAGFASYPAWVVGIAVIGIGLGLPARLPEPPGGGSPLLWAAVLLLAPLFEELLYRERLLPAFRARLGTPIAIAFSSLLFALPHLEPWNVLGAFVVGLMLGAAYTRTRCTALCIAFHAGLNSACLVSGVPPVDPVLEPVTSAIAGSVLLMLSLRWARGRRQGGRGVAASIGMAPDRANGSLRRARRTRNRIDGERLGVVRQRGLEPPRGCPRQPLKGKQKRVTC